MSKSSLPVSAAILLTVAFVILGAVGCGGPGGGSGGGDFNPYNTADATLGDVRVWVRQYTDNTVSGSKHGSRQRDIDLVLINESHRQYAGISSDRLTDAESIVPDVVARALLSQLDENGMLQAENGAIQVTLPPDQYVKGLTQRPHAWIGVEHAPPGKGKSWVFLPRYKPRTPEEWTSTRYTVFNRCLEHILQAKWSALPKDASRGITAPDLESSRRSLPPRPVE